MNIFHNAKETIGFLNRRPHWRTKNFAEVTYVFRDCTYFVSKQKNGSVVKCETSTVHANHKFMNITFKFNMTLPSLKMCINHDHKAICKWYDKRQTRTARLWLYYLIGENLVGLNLCYLAKISSLLTNKNFDRQSKIVTFKQKILQ